MRAAEDTVEKLSSDRRQVIQRVGLRLQESGKPSFYVVGNCTLYSVK
jgi:hypothetical protein